MAPSLSSPILGAVIRGCLVVVAIVALQACGAGSAGGLGATPSPSAPVDVSKLAGDAAALSQAVPQTISACDPAVTGFSPQTCEASASATADLLSAAAQNADDAATAGSAPASRLRTVLDRCTVAATSLAGGTGSAKLLDGQLADCWEQAQRAYQAAVAQ